MWHTHDVPHLLLCILTGVTHDVQASTQTRNCRKHILAIVIHSNGMAATSYQSKLRTPTWHCDEMFCSLIILVTSAQIMNAKHGLARWQIAGPRCWHFLTTAPSARPESSARTCIILVSYCTQIVHTKFPQIASNQIHIRGGTHHTSLDSARRGRGG